MTDTDDNPGPRKYAGNTRGRPFEKGNRGRPAGSRNKVTLAIETLMGKYGKQVAEHVVKCACEGGHGRIPSRFGAHCPTPPRARRPLENARAQRRAERDECTCRPIGCGRCRQSDPEEAEPVSAMLGAHLKTVETVDIDRRLRELESKTMIAK
jgi:hypothetical protein